MEIDILIDQFVGAINNSSKERLQAKDVPVFLRNGKDENDWYSWSIKRSDNTKWIDDVITKLPKRLPLSFLSLYQRYVFPAFEAGSILLFANTGENIDDEWSKRIFKGGFMSRCLFQNGFIQFANPEGGNFDPVCFDAKQASKRTFECPIIQLDHEEILCHSRIKVKREIATSFTDFVKAIIEKNKNL